MSHSLTPRSLTQESNLEALRREAKRWHKAVLAGDAKALERFHLVYPAGSAAVRLREVQQALAREHGFASWAGLKQELEDRSRSVADNVALFLEKSVHRYGTNPATGKWGNYERDGDARGALAARLLQRHPAIARENIHTAVAAHDLDAVRHWLAKDGALANDRCAFDGWTPLSRLAYARLPVDALSANALAIAHLLLDAGADPNAPWSDGTNAFTPLVGIIGGGEAGQSAHPMAEEFARLLIARGADPSAPQALYNTSLGEDSTFWLDFLWAELVKRGETVKWTGPAPEALGGEGVPSALAYLLGNAVPRHPKRTLWLLEHGADARGVNFYSKEPVIKYAQMNGFEEVTALLVRFGAQRIELSEEEAFLGAVSANDIASVQRLAQANPAFLKNCAAMFMAIAGDRVDLAQALLDLGMSPDVGNDKNFRALHYTTHCGAAGIAQLLIARGAEIDPLDATHNATPLRHAIYQGRQEMIDIIAPHSSNLRGLCFAGAVERLRALLEEEPDGVNREEPSGQTPLFCLPGNEDKAVEVAELLLAFGADREFRDPSGQTPGQAARRRGLEEAADLIEGVE